MPRALVLCQHGSHAAAADFLPLKNIISLRLAHEWKTRNLNPSDFSIDFFAPTVNEGLGTDAGTKECVRKLMPGLIEKMTSMAKEHAASPSPSASEEKIFLTVCGHSFGGILLRETVSQLFSNPEYARISSRFSPLSFVSVASPHCGVRSMFYPMVLGGRILGKIYSSTYAELLLDDELLSHLAAPRAESTAAPAAASTAAAAASTVVAPVCTLASFKHRLLVGAYSHDHLVCFETATLMNEKDIVDPHLAVTAAQQQQQEGKSSSTIPPPHPLATITRVSTTPDGKATAIQSIKSTHVGEKIHLPALLDDSAAAKLSFSRLDDDGKKIAMNLRKMSWDVIPVFNPGHFFLVAHDALMRKGLNSGALSDTVDAVAAEIVDHFFVAVDEMKAIK